MSRTLKPLDILAEAKQFGIANAALAGVPFPVGEPSNIPAEDAAQSLAHLSGTVAGPSEQIGTLLFVGAIATFVFKSAGWGSGARARVGGSSPQSCGCWSVKV
jgi:hypothetical protein